MDVFTASLRSACSLRRGHFVNNLNLPPCRFFCAYDTGTDIKNTALPRAPESPADIIAAQKNHVTGQETVIWLNYLTILAGSPFIHLEQCETVV
ncbi:hypothetical protein KD5_03870 [Yersinia pseudotuberculosis]|nr:isocitrate dehydrogenase kinase/phosphatase domain protein [Yersinia pseudotuberculosis str. PA3606]RYC20423.1 hypothetical protein EU971_18460 [Yersinia pseudotuberculosis]BET60932.1 hypothetical protein YPSE1_03910 [Yersinia pseudotuberculosis]CFV32676.1 isocitrate dehydrogenase kinase/phosphatase [Yersinia pseudotuberculosis]